MSTRLLHNVGGVLISALNYLPADITWAATADQAPIDLDCYTVSMGWSQIDRHHYLCD